MSKRSSTTSKNFAGITWGFGKKIKKKSEKLEKKNKDLDESYMEQWNSICKTFGFVLSLENKTKYDKLKLMFNENRQIRIKSIQNVECFRIYCQKKKKEFTLENYFNSEMNTFDFKSKLPEVYLESKSK